ncbi:uncharacterized protein PFL1_01367 [Pseudozyma flocculosa PF-1]|uniref:uncharacterized protein n=1 Tax=Pseudozyma flocculosa PF-1 TaxID=1277687 RepID=UPI000456186B|nr:uncharacterized protein PFL1_01367 [Pseudozyma flocculosa PF-1]EPQ31179.1 hypothetical protein PFL1_01367 [Pseudozyma flocculosa PF-1]
MTTASTTGTPRTVYWSDYDLASPPPRTSDSYVRFVVLADTHSTEPAQVPDGDVLLHAGDLTALGSDDEMIKQVRWIQTLPHAKKVIIAGNHDFSACSEMWYETRGRDLHARYDYPPSDTSRVRQLLENLPPDVVYLDNDQASFNVDRQGVSHKTWKVWGSPWSPYFGGWAWNYRAGEEAKKVHAGIPRDTDILLTHSPPHAIGGLDKIDDGTSVGCAELTRKLLHDNEVRPRIHAFGHIHEARGVYHHRYDLGGGDETVFVNAAMVEFESQKGATVEKFVYHIVHKPVIVDVLVE